MPLSARAPDGVWSLATDFNWGSTALIQNSSDEHLVVDAETREWRLGLTRRIAERWTLELELPYRQIDGGSLDGFIDDWHEAFGLPDGARSEQPEDRMRLHYSRAGRTLIETGSDAEGLGDASLTLGWQLLASPASSVRAALSMKVPTGDNHWFTSSGGVDLSALLAAEHQVSERWSVSAQAAVTKLSEGEILEEQQRDLVWSARTTLGWQATRAVDLIIQFDAHTSIFEDSELDFFDDTVVLTLGGAYHFASDWTLTLGVSEDIMVERSPDVVFVFGLSRGMKR
jgi:hypothetical protein